jgi:hypothetical protein
LLILSHPVPFEDNLLYVYQAQISIVGISGLIKRLTIVDDSGKKDGIRLRNRQERYCIHVYPGQVPLIALDEFAPEIVGNVDEEKPYLS